MLRDYQEEAVDAVIRYDGKKDPMLVMATGTGKTSVGVHIFRSFHTGIWLAHTTELVRQAYDTFCHWFPDAAGDAGFVGAGLGSEYHKRYIFAKKGSVARRIPKMPKPDVVVVDESHHSMAPQYHNVLVNLRAPHTKVVGLTATPDEPMRTGPKLEDQYEVVYSFDMLEAQRRGWLLPLFCAVEKPARLDLKSVRIRSGEYATEELEAELMRASIVEHTVKILDQPHQFKRLPFHDEVVTAHPREMGGIIVYCVTIEHAKRTHQALVEAGWAAALLHQGSTDRAQTLEDFASGKIKVVVNVGILLEGVDLPRAQMIVPVRATQSRSLFIQAAGRAVRPFPGQERAYILDPVGSSQIHSLISAPVLVGGTDCEASLDGRHHYLTGGAGQAVCSACGARVPCVDNLGPHRYSSGRCSCGATQCEDSPDKTHVFASFGPGKMRCVACGMESPDPFSALAQRSIKANAKVDWYQIGPRVEVNILRRHGLLFVVKELDGYTATWYREGVAKKLNRGSVRREEAVALAEDVALRTKPYSGRYGYLPTANAGLLLGDAKLVARKLGYL